LIDRTDIWVNNDIVWL